MIDLDICIVQEMVGPIFTISTADSKEMPITRSCMISSGLGYEELMAELPR
jgi:hypothetical protein